MSDIVFKVIVIGDPTVGKTSLIQRYVNDEFRPNYRGTIGVDFAVKKVKTKDNRTVKLQLWDIAGQEHFASMMRVYYKNADGCIIMFDLTKHKSFLSSVRWKQDIDCKCTQTDGAELPCLLLANKCDLSPREVAQDEIEDVCRDQSYLSWTETSAKHDLMVQESFSFLLEEMLLRYNAPLIQSQDISSCSYINVHLSDKSTDSHVHKKSCPC